jgi:hypothetical protein
LDAVGKEREIVADRRLRQGRFKLHHAMLLVVIAALDFAIIRVETTRLRWGQRYFTGTAIDASWAGGASRLEERLPTILTSVAADPSLRSFPHKVLPARGLKVQPCGALPSTSVLCLTRYTGDVTEDLAVLRASSRTCNALNPDGIRSIPSPGHAAVSYNNMPYDWFGMVMFVIAVDLVLIGGFVHLSMQHAEVKRARLARGLASWKQLYAPPR